MKVKMKLEVEVDDVDVLVLDAISRKQGTKVSTLASHLISDALEKIDPREYEPSQNDALPIFTEELTDEFAVISDLIADKF